MAIFGYRSPKLRSWVLLMSIKDEFSVIPADQLTRFGEPQFVRELDPARPLPGGISPKDIERTKEHGYSILELATLFYEGESSGKLTKM